MLEEVYLPVHMLASQVRWEHQTEEACTRYAVARPHRQSCRPYSTCFSVGANLLLQQSPCLIYRTHLKRTTCDMPKGVFLAVASQRLGTPMCTK